MVDTNVEAVSAACLELAQRGSISAYDAESVLVAEQMDLELVTGDRRIVKAFPDRVVLLEDWASRK